MLVLQNVVGRNRAETTEKITDFLLGYFRTWLSAWLKHANRNDTVESFKEECVRTMHTLVNERIMKGLREMAMGLRQEQIAELFSVMAGIDYEKIFDSLAVDFDIYEVLVSYTKESGMPEASFTTVGSFNDILYLNNMLCRCFMLDGFPEQQRAQLLVNGYPVKASTMGDAVKRICFRKKGEEFRVLSENGSVCTVQFRHPWNSVMTTDYAWA